MNYGYQALPEEGPLTLQSEDEQDRFPLQLYHYLAALTPIEGRDVLEGAVAGVVDPIIWPDI